MRSSRSIRARLAAAASAPLLAGACYTPPTPTAPEASDSLLLSAAAEPEASERPEPVPAAGVDWIRLSSDEWIKGEILGFDGDVLAVDSEVLEELELDWADVTEVLTARPFTLLLSDRNAVVGVVRVARDRVRIEGQAGAFEVARPDVTRMVPGRPREANYWTGKVRLSAAVSSGNTERTNTAFFTSLRRETAASRSDLSLDSVVEEADGRETVNNHTFRGRHDVYLSPRLYVTPLGLELFRDEFQNVDLRATPFSGLGYELVDEADLEWHVDAGLGYRITRFRAVPAGADGTDETATLVLGTAASADLTERIELELAYAAQVGLQDLQDTNQDASALLSTDLAWDLDLDLRVVWKWVGAPETGADGTTPEKDDLRVELGLSWDL